MFFYCVEPEHDKVKKKTDYYDWKFTIKKGLSHHILFPHVDSCLGVVCDLGGDRVFAGHVNGYSPETYQQGFTNLLNELKKEKVERAIAFGDIANWKQTGKVKIPWPIVMTVQGPDNGLDVMVDIDAGDVQIMKWVKDRDFKKVKPVDAKWKGNIFQLAKGGSVAL